MGRLVFLAGFSFNAFSKPGLIALLASSLAIAATRDVVLAEGSGLVGFEATFSLCEEAVLGDFERRRPWAGGFSGTSFDLEIRLA